MAERNWPEACSDFGGLGEERSAANNIQILGDVPPWELGYDGPPFPDTKWG